MSLAILTSLEKLSLFYLQISYHGSTVFFLLFFSSESIIFFFYFSPFLNKIVKPKCKTPSYLYFLFVIFAIYF